MASWSDVVDFGEAFSSTASSGGDNDRPVGIRVMSDLPVIVLDREAGIRGSPVRLFCVSGAQIGLSR